MVLSLLPDRGTERGSEGGREGQEGHRGGPGQDRGVFYSKTQSFWGWKEWMFGFGGGMGSTSSIKI